MFFLKKKNSKRAAKSSAAVLLFHSASPVHVRTTEGAFLRAYICFLGTVSMRKFMVKIGLICPRKKKPLPTYEVLAQDVNARYRIVLRFV